MLTGLILVCSLVVGLLLCADDLVVRAPGVIGKTIQHVRPKTPVITSNLKQLNSNIKPLAKLTSLPKFVTKDSADRDPYLSPMARRITQEDSGMDDAD